MWPLSFRRGGGGKARVAGPLKKELNFYSFPKKSAFLSRKSTAFKQSKYLLCEDMYSKPCAHMRILNCGTFSSFNLGEQALRLEIEDMQIKINLKGKYLFRAVQCTVGEAWSGSRLIFTGSDSQN